jgi:uncharacterized membrane protein YidH (DUF202 family)
MLLIFTILFFTLATIRGLQTSWFITSAAPRERVLWVVVSVVLIFIYGFSYIF